MQHIQDIPLQGTHHINHLQLNTIQHTQDACITYSTCAHTTAHTAREEQQRALIMARRGTFGGQTSLRFRSLYHVVKKAENTHNLVHFLPPYPNVMFFIAAFKGFQRELIAPFNNCVQMGIPLQEHNSLDSASNRKKTSITCSRQFVSLLRVCGTWDHVGWQNCTSLRRTTSRTKEDGFLLYSRTIFYKTISSYIAERKPHISEYTRLPLTSLSHFCYPMPLAEYRPFHTRCRCTNQLQILPPTASI